MGRVGCHASIWREWEFSEILDFYCRLAFGGTDGVTYFFAFFLVLVGDIRI